MLTVPDTLADGLLPRYRLGATLAEGGQAIVCHARDLALDRDVAIKVLRRSLASAVGVERFLREIRLLADLSHPYIIPILDAGETGGVLWYAMPLVRGETLAVRCATGPVPEPLVRRWGREVAEALGVAHARGVVHRDVKPANVHIVDGHALLADFGVAALRDAPDDLTGTDEAVGTTRYMAPEQRAGRGDARSDLYGLGATLYEASTGTRWDGSSPDWRAVPAQLRPTLRRATAGAPDARWPTAAALAAALERPHLARARQVSGGLLVFMGLWAAYAIIRPMPTAGPFAADLQVVGVGDDPMTAQLLRASVVRLEWFPPLHVAPWGESEARITPRWRAEGMVEWSLGVPHAMITLRDDRGRAIEVLQVAGDTADLPAWGRAVAAAIVHRLVPDLSHDFDAHAGSARIGAALHAYYIGREAFERQDWRTAEEEYRVAVRLDPAFAQAQWGVVQARKWARLPYANELAALAQSPDLPPPLDALVSLQLNRDLGRRLAGLDSLAEAWPNVPEVHLVHANELFHRGTLVGRAPEEGIDALEALARRFPSLDRPVVWDHVVWGAVRQGDESRARRALAERRRGRAGDDPWGTLLRYAVESRFRPWLGTGLGMTLRVFGGGDRERIADAHRLGALFDLPEAQHFLAEWLLQGTPDARRRADAWSGAAVAALMRGRPGDALLALDSAAVASGGDPEYAVQRLEWRTLLPVLGVTVDSANATGALHAVPAADAVPLPGARVAFVHAVAAGASGDTSALIAALGMLRRENADPLAHAVAHSWLLEMRGQVAAGEAAIRTALVDATDAEVRRRGPFVRALAAMRLGELALARADTVTAAQALGAHQNTDVRGWPVGPPQEGEIDAAVSVASRWRRGTMLLAMGDTTIGCGLRRRAEELWSAAGSGSRDGLTPASRATPTDACLR